MTVRYAQRMVPSEAVLRDTEVSWTPGADCARPEHLALAPDFPFLDTIADELDRAPIEAPREAIERVQFRLISLYCLLCGYQTANVRLPIAGLTRTALRAALAAEAPETQPRWNATLAPLCPRCPGRLILDIRPIHVRSTTTSRRTMPANASSSPTGDSQTDR